MPVVNRLGSEYQVMLVPELTYATLPNPWVASTGIAMTNVTCDIKYEPIMVDTKIKTGSVNHQIGEKIITGRQVTVNLKGILCAEYEPLLQAYFMKAASAYSPTYPQPAQSAGTATGFSYTIAKIFVNDTTDLFDYVLGCHLVSLNITGESNGLVMFDSTWRGTTATYGAANTAGTVITGEPTAFTAGTPFLFSSVTATLFNTKTTMNSFSLNLTKDFADDRIAFQNGLTRKAEFVIGYKGTMDLETIYDQQTDDTHAANVGSQTAVNNTLNIINASKTWAIVTSNRIASFELSDPDKSLFLSKFQLEIAGDGTPVEPLVITVS